MAKGAKPKAAKAGAASEDKPKRGRGRPVRSEDNVGRNAFITATRKLLETVPPAKLTTAMIAREAGADPALLRYYFGDRASLLVAVVEEMLASSRNATPDGKGTPAERLEKRIRRTADFARGAHSMQRLMIDELSAAKSAQIRNRMKELNDKGVASYAPVLEPGQPDALIPTDPVMLYIAVIGMCEFFASGQPMIRNLAPGVSPDELAERYKDFMVKLVLDGLRPR